ncbi:hypothetical protein [Dysgonomonas sp. 216]|nr:hypothetical protein [Dysgonomonas sp. 216]
MNFLLLEALVQIEQEKENTAENNNARAEDNASDENIKDEEPC